MISASLFATLFISMFQQQNGADQLESRAFYVIGWHCDGKGCSSYPRQSLGRVRFNPARSGASLAEAERLGSDWDIVLNCAKVGDRLKRCRVEDDSVGPTAAIRIAKKIAHTVRLGKIQRYRRRA